MDARVSWDEYFMNIARVVATRATCDRKHVGAVLVRDRTILSTGYNGSIRGLPHCTEVGHMMEDGHCVATVHAEANAIIQAAKNGAAIDGADIYITASPCWPCFKMIANTGIRRIVFGEFYRDERIFEYATRLGIELVGPGDAARPPPAHPIRLEEMFMWMPPEPRSSPPSRGRSARSPASGRPRRCGHRDRTLRSRCGGCRRSRSS